MMRALYCSVTASSVATIKNKTKMPIRIENLKTLKAPGVEKDPSRLWREGCAGVPQKAGRPPRQDPLCTPLQRLVLWPVREPLPFRSSLFLHSLLGLHLLYLGSSWLEY